MDRVIFLSYGTGPHVAETRFAVYSAAHHGTAGYGVVVATDDPAPYADLPNTTVERIPLDQFAAWSSGFGHRNKICVLAHVLRRHGGRAAMVDGDTYFLRSPARLFDRVGPGHSAMHVREGELAHLRAIGYDRQRLAAAVVDVGTPGGPYTFGPTMPVWNSGVVGLDAADVGLVDEVLALNDGIRRHAPIVLSEQLAFGAVLGRRTAVSATRAVVFHYHQKFVRDPFRRRLPDLMRQAEAAPPDRRPAVLYAGRPRPTTAKVVKAAVKRRLKPLGLFRDDLETSI